MKENNLSNYHTYYDIVSESWEGDCVSLTVQFYHDASCFLPSHLVQYKLSYSDGEFSFVEYEILSESELVPLVWTV